MSVKEKTTLAGLFKVRNKIGLSRPKLAAASGLHKNTIAACEKGERAGSLTVASTLAECLACKVDDLIFAQLDDRLDEIKEAYLQRQLDHARAERAQKQAEQQEQGAA